MTTLILRTAARLLVPLSLLFAAFLYFKGHQTPGGGFVGGLTCAVALIVHRMATGRRSLHRLVPAPERALIALGLLLALGTGAAALALGLPFLTSNHGYLPLPADVVAVGHIGPRERAKFEWATVMVFDLGVFLVVAGVAVGMIDALTHQAER